MSDVRVGQSWRHPIFGLGKVFVVSEQGSVGVLYDFDFTVYYVSADALKSDKNVLVRDVSTLESQ